MPERRRQHEPWRLDGGGAQVIDLETAVKSGILGGGLCGGIGAAAMEKVDLQKMIDELDPSDEVPAVFICPISLQPMEDPVTLVTGQTYERRNILRWFAVGGLTCPTTMQELWDNSVTPNQTLRQLIHAWFSQRRLQQKKRSEDVQGQAKDLLESLRKAKGQARLQSLKDLRRLAADHPSARTTIAESGGVSVISSLLGPFTSHAVGSEAVAILVSLSISSEAKKSLMQPAKISLIVDLLNEGSIETKINCTKFIASLMAEEGFNAEAVSSLSLLAGLLRLVKDKRYSNGVFSGLTLLRDICRHERILSSMISVGGIPQLVEQLPGLNPSCSELALKILEMISSTEEGSLALRSFSQTIPSLVRSLMRVSEECTKLSLSILLAVCKDFPGECAARAVEVGLAAKLLLVIQSGYAPPLKQQSAELLKLCSVNYTAGNFISKCKLTRTIQ